MRYSGFVFGRFRTSGGVLSAEHSGPGSGTGVPPPGSKPFEPWIFPFIANQVGSETLYAKIGPSKHWVLALVFSPHGEVTSSDNHSRLEGKKKALWNQGLRRPRTRIIIIDWVKEKARVKPRALELSA